MTVKNNTTKIQVFAYTKLNKEDKKLADMAKEAALASHISPQ